MPAKKKRGVIRTDAADTIWNLAFTLGKEEEEILLRNVERWLANGHTLDRSDVAWLAEEARTAAEGMRLARAQGPAPAPAPAPAPWVGTPCPRCGAQVYGAYPHQVGQDGRRYHQYCTPFAAPVAPVCDAQGHGSREEHDACLICNPTEEGA